ncbi:class II aldolase/adducin family protein [Euzebya tangerina]|uniref:class II aldolase/adducin family protein n=1 Tax=Euzebya tangerina TaxID=591198 RepID=UPI000E30D8D8|nr:class II aldolase/adducin family protein [Euzebya tangerina]
MAAGEGRIDQALGEGSPFPSVWPEAPPELTAPQLVALSARILARAGHALDVAGHITLMRDDETMWTTPYGKWWHELTASDILLVDANGTVLEGPWDVTPAIFIHTEIHRVRPDAKVVIHNHPEWSTLLATMHRLPQITDQQACMFEGEMVLHDDFAGGVDTAESGASLAERVAEASVVVLAHEGIIVMGSTVQEATYKFETFERTCRLNARAWMTGQEPVEVPQDKRARLKAMLLRYSTTFYWNGVVRQELAADPRVLD